MPGTPRLAEDLGVDRKTVTAALVLLEQEDVLGHHTTGRSAALYTENYGNHVIRTLARLSHPTLRDPGDEMSEHPLIEVRGLLLVALDGEGDDLDSLEALEAMHMGAPPSPDPHAGDSELLVGTT